MHLEIQNYKKGSHQIHLYESQKCHYKFKNLFNCPEGRLGEYSREFTIPDQFYVVSENAFLIPHSGNLVAFDEAGSFIQDSWPHKYGISKDELGIIQDKATKIRIIDAPEDVFICSLIGGGNSYFHFFLDVLPRIFAAQDYSLRTSKRPLFLCDESLSPWMAQSLYFLGVTNHQILSYNVSLGEFAIRCKSLVSRRGHRCNEWDGDVPYDALSPIDVKNLREKLAQALRGYNFSNLPKKILISRNDSSSRRLLNQFAVMSKLGAEFQAISLSSMDLVEQIAIFKNASHIVAVHGAGLTNLIHSQNASVLEIHSNGHSIRPDFFQICGMNDLKYYFDVCNSVTPQHDVVASLETIQKFKELSY